MNSNQFRKELLKIMPGYKWTVHRQLTKLYISATGIQSSGFNRLSTVEVTRRETDGNIEYSVRSSGYGVNAPWLSEYQAPTLAQALRGLQNFYDKMANKYSQHAGSLESGRKI